jgi:hypothetical protein
MKTITLIPLMYIVEYTHHSLLSQGLVFAINEGDEEVLSTQLGVYVLVGKHDTKLRDVYSSV